MNTASIDRDERTITIENTSYRWAYLFLSFGLLAIIAFRSFVVHQSSWDLLAMLILSGVVAAALRRWQHAFTAGAAKSATFAIIGGVIAAMLLAYAAQAIGAVNAGYRAAQHAVDSAR